MDITNGSFISNSSILNAGAPVDITSSNTVFFNSVTGNVGTIANPILVHTSNEIIVGGIDLAAFDGSSIDDTVHAYPSNPPCVIYFNGVKIKDCGAPPPPPGPGSTSASQVGKGSPLFAVVGFYDSQFTLANNYFFRIYILDERFFRRSIPVFIRQEKPAQTMRQRFKLQPLLFGLSPKIGKGLNESMEFKEHEDHQH